VALPVSRRRFTVDEYERMAEAGILGEDDRVELLEGEIVEMAPIEPVHAGCVNRLNHLLMSRLGDRAVVSVQNPIRLSLHSEPQPDVVLLRARDDFYSAGHAGPGDVLLAVEVCWATAAYDGLVKLPLYARAGVAQAWLVDLDGGAVEAYRLAAPGAGAYGEPEVARGDDTVVIDAFPDVPLAASEILG
jgi:Uma2 family endonuclease